MLFEDPTSVYVVLAAVEVVVVALWAWRRQRRLGWAALAVVAVVVLVGLLAHFVQTDREQIDAMVKDAIANVEAGNVDAACEYLDDPCIAPGTLGAAVPKDWYVIAARTALSHRPVRKIYASSPETEVTGDKAVTKLTATIITETGEGIRGSQWRLEWTRTPDGWRIGRVQIVAPDGLRSAFAEGQILRVRP